MGVHSFFDSKGLGGLISSRAWPNVWARMRQHCNGKWEEDDAREGRGGAELGGRRGRTGKGQGEATEPGRTGGGMEMEGRERRRNAGREVGAREAHPLSFCAGPGTYSRGCQPILGRLVREVVQGTRSSNFSWTPPTSLSLGPPLSITCNAPQCKGSAKISARPYEDPCKEHPARTPRVLEKALKHVVV